MVRLALPALVGVISVGFYCTVAFALLESMGYLGLVWADTAKQMGHMLIMLALVSWQVGMGRAFFGKGTLWILLAGVGAGGMMWALSTMLEPRIAPGFGHDLLLLVVAGGGGLLFYLLLLHWARLPELATVNAWFWQRIKRAK